MINTLSLPKEQIPILLLEGISQTAVDTLKGAGYSNITHLKTALDADELKDALKGIRMVGIRSRTKLTAEVLQSADRLIAVGCFSVGTNQVDLQAAQTLGVPVFNAPFSNTRSVAELTIAEIVMLFRRIFPRSNAAHAGKWEKSAVGSNEVRGKTLGIVGYGNIGSQLAVLAEAMGMRVIYHDLMDKLKHGNVLPANDLYDLLGQSDVVSLHVPQTPQTKNMITEKEIRAMKPGSYLINNARGNVIDLDALAGALKDKHLAGAAIDVFPVEPGSNDDPFENVLCGLDNVILTPHIGGSTQEAQEHIGSEVARKFVEYSDVGSTTGAVNFPQVQLPLAPNATRFIHIHRNIPGVIKRVNDIFGGHEINISGQYLQTQGDVGYVVIDAQGSVADDKDILSELRAADGTIRSRIVNGPSS
ncbi:MAG: phosphoglycerate dehydrogenase [Methyloligellaceae bacterium]